MMRKKTVPKPSWSRFASRHPLVLIILFTFMATGLSTEAKTISSKKVGAVLWQGFRHKWDDNPHRLSQLGSYFSDVNFEVSSWGESITANHKSELRTGAFNDSASIYSKGQFLKSSVLGIHHGNVKPDCLTVRGKVGEKSTVSCEQEISLSDIGFENYDQVSVILRGFRLWSPSYKTGYNTRGFSIRLIPIKKTATGYVFKARFSIHPEHSPDRPLWGDRCSSGSHCSRYKYQAKIYYTLVGVKNSDGNIAEDSKSPTNSYGQHVVMSPGRNPAYASTYARKTNIHGKSGFEEGVVGIQGFEWFLDEWHRTRKDGRYIRELSMDLSNVEYNPQSGITRFRTNMHFDNQGGWPYGYDVTYRMWNTLIQFDDADSAITPTYRFDAELSSGESLFQEEVQYRF